MSVVIHALHTHIYIYIYIYIYIFIHTQEAQMMPRAGKAHQKRVTARHGRAGLGRLIALELQKIADGPACERGQDVRRRSTELSNERERESARASEKGKVEENET
jgi:hypothetical protein